MQLKYKYNLSTEGRKSSATPAQTAKHDVLPYINILDKCTQILREDRIWIRNQLKANDPEILNIFKEARKPLNLQHLQIRLRKHVTAFKSKAKMEQLMKFKENMHLGEYKQEPKKTNATHNPTRYQLNQNSSSVSKGKQKNSYSSFLDRVQPSQEKKAPTYPSKTAGTKAVPQQQHFRNSCQQDYPTPMEEITERESENMTSARHRLPEQCNEGFNFRQGYNQWRRPDQTTKSPFQQLRAQLGNTDKNKNTGINSYDFRMNNFLPSEGKKNQFYQEEEDQHPENQFQDHDIKQETDHPQFNSQSASFVLAQRSGFEQEEYQERNYQDYCGNSYHGYQSSSGKNSQQKNHGGSAQEQEDISDQTNLLNTTSMQFSYALPSSTVKPQINAQNDHLFTSPELLAECRNFLKSKSSGKPALGGIAPQGDLQGSLKPLEFGEVNDQSHHFEGTSQIPCHDTNQGSTMNIYNQINKNSGNIELKAQYKDNFEYFHTFAGQSSQKKEDEYKKQINVNLVPPINYLDNQFEEAKQHFDYSQNQQQEFENHQNPNFHEKEEEVRIVNAEEVVDLLLEKVRDEPQGFIRWRIVEKIIESTCPEAMDAVRDYLYDEDELVLISNVGRVLEDLLEREPHPNDVRSVYRLLDIEQKGHIVQQDVEDFIRQLEESEAEDVESIARLLWRLYESIDEDTEEGQGKRVDYWGMYSRRLGIQFCELNEILKQFQFQIQ